MAGIENLQEEVDSFDDLYRNDLMHAVGVIVLPPSHLLSESALMVGDSGDPASPAGQYFGPFREEVEHIFEDVAKEYDLRTNFDVNIRSQNYAQPPAAQGVPELAFWLWEHGPSALMTIDAAINVGKAVKEATRRIRQKTISKDLADTTAPEVPRLGSSSPRTYWPQLSVTTVVISDAASRYGIVAESVVTVFPRGNEYLGGPDHPNSHNSYLIRIDDGPRTLVYSVRADGIVVEHFQLAGDRITPLELPKLIDEGGMRVVSFPATRMKFSPEQDTTTS